MNPPTQPTPQQQGPQDTLSQMKGYLQQQGYQAPAKATGTGGWYDSIVTSRKEAPPTFSSVGSSLGDIFNKHADEGATIENSNQSPISKRLQTFGNGAAAINEGLGTVISSAIKPEVKKAIGEHLGPLIEQAKNSPAGQSILNWWADLHETHPEVAKNLEATGNIASLLSNAIGGGGAIKGTEATLNIAKDTVAPAVEAAKGTVQGVKDTVAGAKDSVAGLGKKSFNDVYTSQANSTKALGNAVKANTVVKDGKTITPIDTMEAYQATPKVISKTSGGHGLDFTDVKAEAAANSKEANKAVDTQIKDMQQLKPFAFSKKDVMGQALDAASKDKEIVRTASLPGVQTHIKQIFEDYGLKGDTITPEQMNEFRKGANQASQAYYNAQRVAATAGAIPKDVADRAQAFAVLGDTFRENLVKFDPTLDTLLTTERLHNAVQQYASRAHLSSVGISGGTRAGIDAGAAGVGALVGSVGGPAGSAVGAATGFALSEKAQKMLLQRTYEGATKNGGPSSTEGKAALEQTSNIPKTQSKSLESNVPQEGKISKYFAENPPSLGLATKSAVPDPQIVAQDLTPRDIKTIRNYIDLDQGKVPAGGNADFSASTAFDDFLHQEGIDPSLFATEKAKAAYAADLIDHHQSAINEANIPKFVQDKKTGRMQGSKK